MKTMKRIFVLFISLLAFNLDKATSNSAIIGLFLCRIEEDIPDLLN